MTLFIPAKRATVLIPSGPDHDPDRMHLFILLTDPVTEEQLVLFVSISSVREDGWHDSTCILCPGDHPFVVRDSWVDYRTAQIEPAQKILNGVNQGLFVPKGTVEHEVFLRVCEGLMYSDHVKPRVRQFYLEACGN